MLYIHCGNRNLHSLLLLFISTFQSISVMISASPSSPSFQFPSSCYQSPETDSCWPGSGAWDWTDESSYCNQEHKVILAHKTNQAHNAHVHVGLLYYGTLWHTCNQCLSVRTVITLPSFWAGSCMGLISNGACWQIECFLRFFGEIINKTQIHRATWEREEFNLKITCMSVHSRHLWITLQHLPEPVGTWGGAKRELLLTSHSHFGRCSLFGLLLSTGWRKHSNETTTFIYSVRMKLTIQCRFSNEHLYNCWSDYWIY